MDVNSAVAVSPALPAQNAVAGKALGKEEFLTLFVAQLRAQDPLNPMDSTGFTAQLAQFSSLEQLTNINSGIENLTTYQSSLQNTMTTGLIGKKVVVAGNTIRLNGTAELRYSLAAPATKVTVSIFDQNGALVRQQELANQGAGTQALSWDGKDAGGNVVPPGQYRFTVEATDASGTAVPAATLNTGTVMGVTFENNLTYLVLDNGAKVQLGDIREIGG